MKKLLGLLLLLSFSSYAGLELKDVTGQFLNIHGTDWSKLAQTQEDWNDIRSWHEKIIDEPNIILEVHPEPSMVEYLHPIAIHSYGQLIGENQIELDEKSKEVLESAANNLSDQSLVMANSTIAAIGLTNSPWGLNYLQNLLTESNTRYHQAIYSNIENVVTRLSDNTDQNKEGSNLDTNSHLQKNIDYSKNKKAWDKAIYNTRKKITKLYKKNAKQVPASLVKVSKSLNQSFSKIQKMNISASVNNSLKQTIEKSMQDITKKKIVLDNNKKSKPKINISRQTASLEEETEEETGNARAIIILLILLGFGVWFFKRLKER